MKCLAVDWIICRLFFSKIVCHIIRQTINLIECIVRIIEKIPHKRIPKITHMHTNLMRASRLQLQCHKTILVICL